MCLTCEGHADADLSLVVFVLAARLIAPEVRPGRTAAHLTSHALESAAHFLTEAPT